MAAKRPRPAHWWLAALGVVGVGIAASQLAVNRLAPNTTSPYPTTTVLAIWIEIALAVAYVRMRGSASVLSRAVWLGAWILLAVAFAMGSGVALFALYLPLTGIWDLCVTTGLIGGWLVAFSVLAEVVGLVHRRLRALK